MKEYRIVELLARESVINAIKRYGLEGCEEAIKGVYRNMIPTRDLMLKEYYKILRRKR
ncbi:hypothetical protein LCGC14_2529780 [marine sediment metagenome]|uniref:Uncharacterized protein n=1 Tax=marine sediment metagenome TaxID=412755 RepID=A0A0F9ATW0_9ZZZZ